MKKKPNLDHLDSSKGRPRARTQPVSGLQVWQDKGGRVKRVTEIHCADLNTNLQTHVP
jgi:hypothetical protein